MLGWGLAVVAIILMIYNLFFFICFISCSEKSKQIYGF
ncbi:hypothetical protein FLJC2902T_18470 [Flavobacterium limnosediminis JC2902]|uniref:Uncharacterized protein n=1 Tax=Flavobacterium limnosediminis JC2902 TaxID=1341181 RepID=V6SVL5_9FLAO|nr:hypothetical protein FLJC2902T_18470 [Flavobacterium limnosediminis JC2902]